MPRDRAIRNGQKRVSLRAKRGNPVAMVVLDCRASLAMTILLTKPQQKTPPAFRPEMLFYAYQ
jgi:hypothetical protein